MKRIVVLFVVSTLLVLALAAPAMAAKPKGDNCRDGTPFITVDENQQHAGAYHGCGGEFTTTGGKGNCGSKDGAPFVTQGQAAGAVHACGEPITVT